MFGETALSLLLLKLFVVVIKPGTATGWSCHVTFPRVVCRRDIVKSQIVRAGISKLCVIEDIEYLYTKLQGNSLGELGFLHERQVDLPGVQRPDETVRSVAKSTDESARIDTQSRGWVGNAGRIKWRRSKGRRVNG